MRRQQEEILDYLNTAYCGAKMAEDVECMIRLARAIAAFNTDPYTDEKEYFTEKFVIDSVLQ